MPGKALITSEFPTPADVASHLRIPPARVAELRQMLDLDVIEKKKVRGGVSGRKGSASRAKKK